LKDKWHEDFYSSAAFLFSAAQRFFPIPRKNRKIEEIAAFERNLAAFEIQ